MIVEALLVVLLGVAAGTVATMFGVGGGTVLVPTLVIVVGLGQLHAEATSLLAIVPVALVATWRQRGSGHIRPRDAAVLGAASIPAAVLGALLADAAPDRVLRVGFAALLIVVAAELVRRARGAAAPS